MKVLVIGSQGSMGRRYCAILKYLNVDYVGADGKDPNIYSIDYRGFSHCILAVPTDGHVIQINYMSKNYPTPNILCEKPIDKHPYNIKRLMRFKSDIRMVCNWKYIVGSKGTIDIDYSCYNTGKDGLGWDCIQLIYLARKLKISTDTPYFQCIVNHNGMINSISLADIEQSYITMIKKWLSDDNDLWTLEDALKATEKVLIWNKENE